MLPLLASLITPAHALEPGPFLVSSRDVTWVDSEVGRVWATIHYPAIDGRPDAPPDLSGGPYPLAAFLHGWLGSAWMYTDACDHLASLGFVVVNMDTETHVFLDPERFAQDTVAALEWTDARSLEADHWLGGMVSGDDWTAMGHSMGGATLARIIGYEPRVRTLVGFMPYESDTDADYANMAAFDGRALYLVGTEDTTSTPAMVGEWFEHMHATERGLYANIVGAGHQAVSNFEWGDESMPDRLQREVVLTYASRFLNHEVLADERALRDQLYDPPADTVAWASRSRGPAIWLDAPDPDTVELGALTDLDGAVVLYAGSGPGETMTTHGPIDLGDATAAETLPAEDGIVAARLPVSPALAASWVQVAVVTDDGVTLGEPTDLFGVGLPDDDTPAGTTDPTGTTGTTDPGTDGGTSPGADPGTTADPTDPGSTPPGADGRGGHADEDLAAAGRCGGCSQGGTSPGWLLLVAAAGLRRRR